MQVPRPALFPARSIPLLHTWDRACPRSADIVTACRGGHSCVRPWEFLEHDCPGSPRFITIPFLQTAKPRSLSKGPQIPQGSYRVRSPTQACLCPELALGTTLLPAESSCLGQPTGSLEPELGSERWSESPSRVPHLPAWKGSLISVIITQRQGAVAFTSPAGSLGSLRKTMALALRFQVLRLRGDPAGFARCSAGHTASVCDGITLQPL